MKRYYVEGKGYIDINENDDARFRQDFPDAKEVMKNTYTVEGKGDIDIYENDVDAFIKDFPNAKKKTQGGIEDTSSEDFSTDVQQPTPSSQTPAKPSGLSGSKPVIDEPQPPFTQHKPPFKVNVPTRPLTEYDKYVPDPKTVVDNQMRGKARFAASPEGKALAKELKDNELEIGVLSNYVESTASQPWMRSPADNKAIAERRTARDKRAAALVARNNDILKELGMPSSFSEQELKRVMALKSNTESQIDAVNKSFESARTQMIANGDLVEKDGEVFAASKESAEKYNNEIGAYKEALNRLYQEAEGLSMQEVAYKAQKGDWGGYLQNTAVDNYGQYMAGAANIIFKGLNELLPEESQATGDEITRTTAEMFTPWKEELKTKDTTKEFGEKYREDSFIGSSVAEGIAILPELITPYMTGIVGMSYQGAAEEVEKMEGLTQGEKEFYKLATVATEYALEKLPLSKTLKNAPGLRQLITGNVMSAVANKAKEESIEDVVNRTIGSTIKTFALDTSEGALAEGATGGLQEASNIAIKEGINAYKGSEAFEEKEWVDYIADIVDATGREAVGGSLLSGTVNSVNAFSKGRQTAKTLKYANLLNTEDGWNVFTQHLDKLELDGAITPERRDQITADAEKMLDLTKKAGKLKDNPVAIELLKEKEDIAQSKEAIDPAIAAPMVAREKAINEALTLMASQPPQEERMLPHIVVAANTFGLTPSESAEGVFVSHPKAIAQIALSEGSDPNTLKLESIRTAESERGKGIGAESLKAVTDFADEAGVALEIEVVPEGEDISTPRLLDWYAKNGFVQVEGRGDTPRMVRQPSKRVETIPVSSISEDPARFQYKSDVDPKTGVSDKLKKSKWQDDLSGVISVWEDPNDGTTYVVNGHHRLALAKSRGIEEIDVKRITAATAEDARTIGALQNIVEGMGTAVDAAKIFRDTGMKMEDISKKGLSIKNKISNEGMALAALSQPMFDAVVRGDIPAQVGVSIGNNISSHDIQEQFWETIKSRRLPMATIEIMAQDISASPKEAAVVEDLFGTTEKERADYESRAKLIAATRGIVAKAKNLLGRTANAKKFLEEYGNKIDEESNKQASRDAAEAVVVFDALRNSSKAISQMLDEGQARVKSGEKLQSVASEIAKSVIENADAIMEGRGIGVESEVPIEPKAAKETEAKTSKAKSKMEKAKTVLDKVAKKRQPEKIRLNLDQKQNGTHRIPLEEEQGDSGKRTVISTIANAINRIYDTKQSTEKELNELRKGEADIVETSMLPRLKRAFLNIGTEILDTAESLMEKAKELAGTLYPTNPDTRYNIQLPDGRKGRMLPEVVNGFYSPLEKIVMEAKSDKMPATQWLDKFAKGEEAKWTGLTDWLNQQQGSVSKADIQQFLKDNRIQVVEVVKNSENIGAVWNEKYEAWETTVDGKPIGDFADTKDEAIRYGKDNFGDNTKFGNYQLSGDKENYAEKLILLPNKEVNIPSFVDQNSDYIIEAYKKSGKLKVVCP